MYLNIKQLFFRKQILLTSLLSIFFIAIGAMSCNKDTPIDDENPESKFSPYITRVFEYCPAPGQFINQLPKYEVGDTPETMAKKAEVAIARNNGGMISLGGFGGYVIVGFDHTIQNIIGKADFIVQGNAYSGNSEPGIVMVSVDSNRNGIPDDEWFELAGSEYNNKETIMDYQITYYRPDDEKAPEPHETLSYVTDKTYILWNTNGYGEGYLYKTSYHAQNYYPLWIDDNKLSFSGNRLPKNQIIENDIYRLHSFDWGYADNVSNDNINARFDIDWAVDKNGEKVYLAGIDFIKIYTAVHQFNGVIGESSTEVIGVIDLNITAN